SGRTIPPAVGDHLQCLARRNYHSFAEGTVSGDGPPRPGSRRDCQLSRRDVRGLRHVGKECSRSESVECGNEKYCAVAPDSSCTRASPQVEAAFRLRSMLLVLKSKWFVSLRGAHPDPGGTDEPKKIVGGSSCSKSRSGPCADWNEARASTGAKEIISEHGAARSVPHDRQKCRDCTGAKRGAGCHIGRCKNYGPRATRLRNCG